MEPTSYKCLKIAQRNTTGSPTFVMFSAKAKAILSWAAIERLDDKSQTGPQRIEKPYKVKAIKSFFEADPNNTIPTAVVIGFSPGTTRVSSIDGCDQLFDLSFIFSEGTKTVGTIVDGQHRVLGINSFDPEAPINVIGLIDVDDAETAFQFLVINQWHPTGAWSLSEPVEFANDPLALRQNEFKDFVILSAV